MQLHHFYRHKQTASENEQQEARMRVEEFPETIQEKHVYTHLNRIKTLKITLSSITALLLIATLISGVFLLVTLRMHSATRLAYRPLQVKPAGKVVVTTQWNGLAMSMKLTAGPYFLGELVAVDFSLTNQTHQTLALYGMVHDPCPGAFSLAQVGGESPHYRVFTEPILPAQTIDCVREPTPLAPGATFAYSSYPYDDAYETLTSSGDMTLVGKANIQPEPPSSSAYPGSPFPSATSSLLAGHFPTLHIHVVPQVPNGKTLKIQQESYVFLVDAPTGVHPLVQSYVVCRELNSTSGYFALGSDSWYMPEKNILPGPECSGGTIVQWNYTFGAEGYEVIQGQQGHYAGPYNH